MYHIQQEELFSFEQLMELQTDSKYTAILEHLPLETILRAVSKKGLRGRSERLNTRAMVYSLVIAKLEKIPFVKGIISRLSSGNEFRRLCRFTDSDPIPSESSYSRLITKLHQCGVLSEVQDQLVVQGIHEGFISGDTLAIDSSHIEAWDRNPKLDKEPKAEQTPQSEQFAAFPEQTCQTERTAPLPKPKRKKRGRVPKAEAEAWRQQVAAYEASLSSFERSIEAMRSVAYEDLIAEMPQYPSTGAKGDPRGTGRVMFWYGYKANLIIDTRSQYIVSGAFCSGHVHDQRLAIVLMKQLQHKFPMLQPKHILADKGYDGMPIYEHARELKAFALIPLIHHAKELPLGWNEDFSPLCSQGHTYRYDSFDQKYETLKYTKPKECSECPLHNEGCQKIHKIRIATNHRHHTVPARGSESFKTLFKQRTAVERVFAYLKLYFGMGTSRLRRSRARIDFDLSCLTYNLCKYALDRMNQQIGIVKQAS